MADGLGNKAAIQALIQTEVSKMFANFMTDEGGFFREMIAGEDLVRGEQVAMKSTVSSNVVKNPVDGNFCIGVVYASANVGDIVKIVHSGTAYMLPESGVTATQGYICYSSNAEAGRADQSATRTANIYREYAVWAETGSGAGVIALAILHFN